LGFTGRAPGPTWTQPPWAGATPSSGRGDRWIQGDVTIGPGRPPGPEVQFEPMSRPLRAMHAVETPRIGGDGSLVAHQTHSRPFVVCQASAAERPLDNRLDGRSAHRWSRYTGCAGTRPPGRAAYLLTLLGVGLAVVGPGAVAHVA